MFLETFPVVIITHREIHHKKEVNFIFTKIVNGNIEKDCNGNVGSVEGDVSVKRNF